MGGIGSLNDIPMTDPLGSIMSVVSRWMPTPLLPSSSPLHCILKTRFVSTVSSPCASLWVVRFVYVDRIVLEQDFGVGALIKGRFAWEGNGVLGTLSDRSGGVIKSEQAA